MRRALVSSQASSFASAGANLSSSLIQLPSVDLGTTMSTLPGMYICCQASSEMICTVLPRPISSASTMDSSFM